MITNDALERVRGWFTGRLPEQWRVAPPEITVDRDEITVVLTIDDVDLPDGSSDAERSEARAGRAKAFREDTRDRRIRVAREAEHRFERKVSWAVRVGDRTELFTHVATPTMTRLRQPERLVLDTLVDAGVARSRADALAWCVRLVKQHEQDWLAQLREAMEHVADVRGQGPAA
ncbi:hypothetical protein [Intrasporangium sp.]|uniref:hypothetical protein n=1 Tax=Intrasporangium sp. TaxID=1925024 RepID=UPI003221D05C